VLRELALAQLAHRVADQDLIGGEIELHGALRA